jgi:peptide subunit release factor RF-3
VLKERLNVEYGLPVDFEMARFSVCRWISADRPLELSTASSKAIAATSPATSTAIRCSSRRTNSA